MMLLECLQNRLKLGAEMAFPITPIFYGVGKFGKPVCIKVWR